jgi:orotidine-5'-phosphate decarboxylase
MEPQNHFADRLAAAVSRMNSPVCVGLDPRWKQLPETLRRDGGQSRQAQADAYLRFCSGVCDVVAPLVPIVKVQAAFFEELGPAGMATMGRVIEHARGRGLLVIVDGKRNDIGSTAEAYARAYLGTESAWGADALTVSPYLGDDSLTPFCERAASQGAGIFVLVKTSNPGGRMLQDVPTPSGEKIYEQLAQVVEQLAGQSQSNSGYGAVGAVVGATYPEELAQLRASMPHTWFLVPGYGSQGGTAADVVAGFDARGLGAIVNNSRGILFAHERPAYARFGAARWQEAVEAATRDMIAELGAGGWGLVLDDN